MTGLWGPGKEFVPMLVGHAEPLKSHVQLCDDDVIKAKK